MKPDHTFNEAELIGSMQVYCRPEWYDMLRVLREAPVRIAVRNSEGEAS